MERVTELIENDPYADALGISLVSADDERIVVEMPLREEHLNFHGVTHGGAVFSVADCAFSLASNAAGDKAVAIDTHLAITAGSASGDVLRAEAIEVTKGRRLATYRVTVTRSDGKVVALFTGTVFVTPPDG